MLFSLVQFKYLQFWRVIEEPVIEIAKAMTSFAQMVTSLIQIVLLQFPAFWTIEPRARDDKCIPFCGGLSCIYMKHLQCFKFLQSGLGTGFEDRLALWRFRFPLLFFPCTRGHCVAGQFCIRILCHRQKYEEVCCTLSVILRHRLEAFGKHRKSVESTAVYCTLKASCQRQ